MEGRPPPVTGTTPTERWLPIAADVIERRRIAAIPVTQYRYRGSQLPHPKACTITPDRAALMRHSDTSQAAMYFSGR